MTTSILFDVLYFALEAKTLFNVVVGPRVGGALGRALRPDVASLVA